jgi:hypothetical protein
MQKIIINKIENEIIVRLDGVKDTKNIEKTTIAFSLANDTKITNDNIATFLVTLSTQLTTHEFEYEIEIKPESTINDEHVKFIKELVKCYIDTFKKEYEAQLDKFEKQVMNIKTKINES